MADCTYTPFRFSTDCTPSNFTAIRIDNVRFEFETGHVFDRDGNFIWIGEIEKGILKIQYVLPKP